VKNGLYRNIRHPSYTGFLLRYLGGGLAFANWLSLIIIFLPMLAAILYRIKVEEGALIEAFGSEYIDYASSAKRLIPKVY
jgi:protein-S-isoprenylcysteine O-methyltransferase Ste14